MQWQGRQGSSNVEDVRGGGGSGFPGGGMAAGGGGIGCLGIIIAIIYMMMGGNPGDILGGFWSAATDTAATDHTDRRFSR